MNPIAAAAEDIVRKEYLWGGNKRVDVRRMAKRLGVTPNYLSEIYHWDVGRTIVDDVNLRRIDLAKELLIKTNLKVRQIARATGYTSSAYFSRIFGKKVGVRPLDYRRRFKESDLKDSDDVRLASRKVGSSSIPIGGRDHSKEPNSSEGL